MRVAVIAADPMVLVGLERVFLRHGGVEILRLRWAALNRPRGVGEAEDPGSPTAPDLIVLDVWPPAADAADICAAWHAQYPDAAIVAVVHHPTPSLLARVRRAGGSGLWPKGDVRDLAGAALALTASARPTSPNACPVPSTDA